MVLTTENTDLTGRIIIDLTADDGDDDENNESNSANRVRDSSPSNLDLIPVSQTQWSSANEINRASLQNILEKPFPGNVIVSARPKAMKQAQSDSNLPGSRGNLVFWTDGSVSRANGICGVAVVYCDHSQPHRYVERAWSIRNIISSDQVELFGIAEAMKIAVRICRTSAEGLLAGHHDNLVSVTIYTDSTSALDKVKRVYTLSDASETVIPRQVEIAKIRQRALHLQNMGILVNLRWVPGHSGIAGNVLADKLAGQASMVRQRQRNRIFEEMIPRNDPLSIRSREKLANRDARRNVRSATKHNTMQRVEKVSRPQPKNGKTANRFERLFNRLNFQDALQTLKDMISKKS